MVVELPTGTVTPLFTDIEGWTPAELVASSDPLTARHLRAYLERA